MSKLYKKELIIGACVIVALAILFFGIDYLKGINLFKPANFYIAKYENVAGLEVAAPVTIDGYKVGQVREINFDYDHPGKVEVLLALNNKLHLPEDSEAAIGHSLLGGASIEIKMGRSKRMIPVGGEIRTFAGEDLMASLQENLLPQVYSIMPKVDTLLYSLNLLATNPALARSINRFDGITSNIAMATTSLNGTLSKDVPVIMNNTKGITNNIGMITADLGQLSTQLKNLPIDVTMGNVEQATANLKLFSEQLNDKNGTLGMLMNDPELYNRANRIAADLDSLIVDLQRNPKRYVSIKLF